MSEKLYSVIELVVAALFIALGIVVVSNSTLFEGYIQYVMVGFIIAKMFLIVGRTLTFQLNQPFMIVQLLLNAAILVLLFIFQTANVLSFVVSGSCFVDLLVNILQSIFFRKSENEVLRTSFFGIENVIYIIFIVILIFNKDSDLLATGVLFGTIILYKGAALLLSNPLVRNLIDKTDFGQALRKVHGLDVLFGLLIIVVMASFIFPYLEPTVFTNPEDALWYCFTLITTIGTGDFVAVTRLGRILSVIIGCYGIIIVSILTSAIVVYINKVQSGNNKKK